MAQASVKTLTLNCNGLNSKIKSKRILSVMLKSHADVIFLQKTHLKRTHLPVFKSPRFPLQLQAPGISKSRSVAILFSVRLCVTLKDQLTDPEGCFLFINVHIEGEPFTLASLCVPNKKQTLFLEKCSKSLQSFACGLHIVGGDLNCLMNSKLDYSGSKKARDPVRLQADSFSTQRRILEQYNLQDVWRLHHPKERDYTFYLHRHKSHSRLDYILVSMALAQNFISSSI